MKSTRKDFLGMAVITLVGLSFASLALLAVSIAVERRITPETTIRELNQRYIEAFLHSDVEWYRSILSDDFVCIDSDGSILHKAGFLKQAGQGPDVISYELEKVNVRLYGDVALVQATGRFTRKNGTVGHSHYTDIYVHEGEDWKVVSAQVTRGS
jgi:ketosteroid isomerase-like protein